MGLGGKEEVSVGSTGNYLTAIDPTTGKIVWRRPYPSAGGGFGGGGGGGGLLTTAGKLVFAGDAGGNFVAYDAETGAPLVAFPHRQRQQRRGDVHARRPPAHPGGRGRHAVRVRALRVDRPACGVRPTTGLTASSPR